MAKFDYDYIVCQCKQVRVGEVVYAIKEQGATTLKDIKKFTDAGSACKCCKSEDEDFNKPKLKLYLTDILEKIDNN